jgi:hypothetical protein
MRRTRELAIIALTAFLSSAAGYIVAGLILYQHLAPQPPQPQPPTQTIQPPRPINISPGYSLEEGVFIARLDDSGNLSFSGMENISIADRSIIVFLERSGCPLCWSSFFLESLSRAMLDTGYREAVFVACQRLSDGLGCSNENASRLANLFSRVANTSAGVVRYIAAPEIVVYLEGRGYGGSPRFTEYVMARLSDDPNYTRSRQLWQAIEEFIATYTGRS